LSQSFDFEISSQQYRVRLRQYQGIHYWVYILFLHSYQNWALYIQQKNQRFYRSHKINK